MDRFIVFIIGFVVSILIVKYRALIKDFTGEIGFAEKIFMTGGTHTFIVLFALLVFVGSLMYALGTLQVLVDTILGPFFGK